MKPRIQVGFSPLAQSCQSESYVQGFFDNEYVTIVDLVNGLLPEARNAPTGRADDDDCAALIVQALYDDEWTDSFIDLLRVLSNDRTRLILLDVTAIGRLQPVLAASTGPAQDLLRIRRDLENVDFISKLQLTSIASVSDDRRPCWSSTDSISIFLYESAPGQAVLFVEALRPKLPRGAELWGREFVSGATTKVASAVIEISMMLPTQQLDAMEASIAYSLKEVCARIGFERVRADVYRTDAREKIAKLVARLPE